MAQRYYDVKSLWAEPSGCPRARVVFSAIDKALVETVFMRNPKFYALWDKAIAFPVGRAGDVIRVGKFIFILLNRGF